MSFRIILSVDTMHEVAQAASLVTAPPFFSKRALPPLRTLTAVT